MSVKHIGSKTFYVVKETTKPNNAKSSSRDLTVSAKRDAVLAAKDFGYGDDVIEKIRNAKSITEVSNIMKAARKEFL